MRTNAVKRKLRAGHVSYGAWLSLGHLAATRLLARSGFDWLTLDMEHQPFDWSTAESQFAAIADSGCVPIARVPAADHTLIKRALDAGAFGIVVPMVDTPEQAELAIRAAKFPPLGNRSTGGSAHAMNFDVKPSEYYARANEEILVILQTESPTGIANANMRAADGTEASDEEFEAAIQKVIDIGKKTGTPTGMHTMSADVARGRAEQGMQFLAVGSELQMLSVALEQQMKILGIEGNEKLVNY